MKSLKLFGIFGCTLIILLASCSKDKQLPINNIDKAFAKAKTQRILAFKANLQLKTSGQMASDSAVWYTEGLLNLEQAQNNHNFEDLQFFKDSIQIIDNNGLISMDQINIAYEHFTNRLDSIAIEHGASFKFNLVDISLNATSLKDGSGYLGMDASGGNNIIPLPNYRPFGETDYWYWASDLGKCGGYSGGIGQDAADKLEQAFNKLFPVIQPDGYYTDIVEIWLCPGDYEDPGNPGPYCDLMIFSTNNYSSTPCLAPDELNYYVSKFEYLVDFNNPGGGKSFSNVDVEEDVIVGNPPPNTLLYSYYLYYGVFTINNQ